MKKYICVQGSPEIPKGTIVGFNSAGWYVMELPQKCGYKTLEIWQVESNECWEEVKAETISSTPTRWKPILGQPFYCIDEGGFVEEDEWDGTLGDESMWEIGNCFPTEQQARDEVKRRESIANACRPDVWEECWAWSYDKCRPLQVNYDVQYTADSYIGACHPTEEACRAWGEKYSKYFLPKKS